MPFQSEAQRRWAYANKPEMAKRWQKKTEGDLPERVGKLTQRAYMHAFYSANPEERAVLHAARMVAHARMEFTEHRPTPGEALYVEPMTGKFKMQGRGCRNCWKWSKDDKRCAVHEADLEITADMVCGQHEPGDPQKTRQAISGLQPLKPEYTGLLLVGLHGTKCDDCIHFQVPSGEHVGDVGPCIAIADPEDETKPFDVHRYGCCSLWNGQKDVTKAGPLPYLEPLQKGGCGCPHEDKMTGKCGHGLPMIGKADDMLEEVPWAVKQLMSQLPLEMQATELGGAGSTDMRPTMDQMNYEMPARNAGDCQGCDHARPIDGQWALVCTALQGEPAVSPRARCDLWTGYMHRSHIVPAERLLRKSGDHAGYTSANAQPGDGHARTYMEQTLPDYQYIYGHDAKLQAVNEREAAINRRRASAHQNSGKYAFHGDPPEPVIKFEPDERVEIAHRGPVKGQADAYAIGPKIEASPLPLRERSGIMRRSELHMAGKMQAIKRYLRERGELRKGSANHDDPQGGHDVDPLIFFMDKDDADQYAIPRGLKPVKCDEAMAKHYGVVVGGYVIEHPDTRMYLVAS